MKKSITILSLLFGMVLSAQSIGSDVTQVNIILSQAASIEVLHNNVNLIIDTANKYENGTNSNLTNHLKITSTLPYQLDMQLNNNFTDALNFIPAEKVSITILGQTVPLSTNQINILPTNSASIARYLDVNYTLEGGNHLLLPVGTYSAQLTYTLMPQ